MPSFYEFFAGGGMARAGLGKHWDCLFANDFDTKKGASYRANWGGNELVVDDVKAILPNQLPGNPDLVWGSFPCQDLSLAGGGAGLRGERSGTFWPFISLIKSLVNQNRAPSIIALENVVGTLTSHSGKDFIAICEALDELGYLFGALVIDAQFFVPQSRPRLFFIAVEKSNGLPPIASLFPNSKWHTKALQKAYSSLPKRLRKNWVWWDLPTPAKRKKVFSDIIEDEPSSVRWHTPDQTTELLNMMSSVNLKKVEAAKLSGKRMVGGVYKRTRYQNGVKVQRAEVRFDDIAGCLRTPAGGSSRQLILIVEGEKIKSRLISSRETARLMGLPERYKLPDGYNEAYHLTGDGVAVPVVRYLSKHLLENLLNKSEKLDQAIAA